MVACGNKSKALYIIAGAHNLIAVATNNENFNL